MDRATYIAAPPNSRKVRAADPAALARPGPVYRLAANPFQIFDSIFNCTDSRGFEKVAEHIVAFIQWIPCSRVILSFVRDGSEVGLIIGIDVNKLGVDFFDRPLKDCFRSSRRYFNLPGYMNNVVSIDRSFETLNLKMLSCYHWGDSEGK